MRINSGNRAFQPIPIASANPETYWIELPLTEYAEALEIQRRMVAVKKKRRNAPDVVLTLEHPPVFTIGRHRGLENLMVSQEFLAQRGIGLFQVERGGDITYHGPGQLVAYPLLDLTAAGVGVADYVAGLETVMIQTVAEWGVNASTNPSNRGVWVSDKKLGSIGVAVSHGIVFHGLALNIDLDLAPFGWINPCGLKHVQITRLIAETTQTAGVASVRQAFKQHLSRFLNRPLIPADLDAWLRLSEESE